LSPISFSVPTIDRIAKESDEDEPSKEDTQETKHQVNEEPLSKEKHNQEEEEGELPPKKPRKSSRRSNKEVKEETTSKKRHKGNINL
jgi:hypothetical protein